MTWKTKRGCLFNSENLSTEDPAGLMISGAISLSPNFFEFNLGVRNGWSAGRDSHRRQSRMLNRTSIITSEGCRGRIANIRGDDMIRTASLAAFLSVLALMGCSQSTQPEAEIYRIEDSFEAGVSAWTINSLDDKVDTLTIDWYLVSSSERASQGSLSAKVFMNNLSDAAKIWLEQALDVTPNRTYSVTISFDLASSDQGDLNLFSILANVLPRKPTTSDDVVSGNLDGDFPEGTYNGGIEGFVWLDKSLTKNVTSTDEGKLFFILGIWGTWEGARTYHFDCLKIIVTEQWQ